MHFLLLCPISSELSGLVDGERLNNGSIPRRAASSNTENTNSWYHNTSGATTFIITSISPKTVEQAYTRRRSAEQLPTIREWGRWEGLDRNRQQIEIDIVARRTDGKMLTGAVKWNHRPITKAVHDKHVDMLRRLSESGHAWAREALEPDAILLYVAAGVFEADVVKHARRAGPGVVAWSLEDLYAGS